MDRRKNHPQTIQPAFERSEPVPPEYKYRALPIYQIALHTREYGDTGRIDKY
jgi:hypothetical protein